MMRLRIVSSRNFVGVKSKGVFGKDCAVKMIGLDEKMNKDIGMRSERKHLSAAFIFAGQMV